MNILILLFSLIFPYFDASPELTLSSALVEQPKTVLAFEHSVETNPYIERFDSLAGVSLYSSEEELLLAKGEPLTMVNDTWQNTVEYQYADVSVGVGEGLVLYVHVSSSQAQQYGLRINDVEINPLRDSLQATLGTPYYIAEDGDVYMRGSNALKIYRNVAGEFEGIDLFDEFSS